MQFALAGHPIRGWSQEMLKSILRDRQAGAISEYGYRYMDPKDCILGAPIAVGRGMAILIVKNHDQV